MSEKQDYYQQWQAYKMQGSKAARDELIKGYTPLVKSIAGRLQMGLPASVEYNDLVGYGMLGLLDAMEKFSLSAGVKFETYSAVRVRGAILDGLRAYDWAPRSLRQKGRQVSRVIAQLEASLGRSATDEEIAAALGLEVSQFQQLLGELNGLALLSLDQPLLTGDEGLSELGDMVADPVQESPSARLEQGELRQALAAAIDALPERERLIVALYYHEEMTLKEIGAILDITESRVSQLHTRAILRLRGHLENPLAAKQAAAGRT